LAKAAAHASSTLLALPPVSTAGGARTAWLSWRTQ